MHCVGAAAVLIGDATGLCLAYWLAVCLLLEGRGNTMAAVFWRVGLEGASSDVDFFIP